MSERRVLVIDDESLMREFLHETLSREGYRVDLAGDGQRALEMLQATDYNLVITDVKMPGVSGLDILKSIKENSLNTKVVMITAYGTIEDAVESMKLGAFDYITKPFSADEIEIVVKKALEYQRLVLENRQLRLELEQRYRLGNIIGKSRKMQELFELVGVIARSRSTVLITGESGTGKELIARAIHYNSPRKTGPFIKVNCAALPESLMESELFGHEKGAFTGAIKQKPGRFERADKGTLLLDEISEMSPSLQAKLLRVLQEREFERVGGIEPIKVDVRIIATTNKNLQQEIEKGNFREDLYYRLNVIPIHLPPLRERKEDIPLLAEYFLDTYNRENGRAVEGISKRALEMLMDYDWPGNVRELENYIERAVVICRGRQLTQRDFPRELSLGAVAVRDNGGLKVGWTIKEAERLLISKTLEAYGGSRTKAAQTLGISTRTLRNKLAEYKRMDACKQPF
ncbi:MAG TPA: sigma-54-dependent Fis family transcriptional regulator [Candidatus Latescibacteria bacterium]|nr:sigma-54-dependent Fis family transcriptional regulator [Candidatus Latescibacterota bacterium]